MNDQNLFRPAYYSAAVWTAMLVILTLAIWLRVTIADGESIWRDEAQTVAIASRTFPDGILDALQRDGNSPLFYLCEHFLVSDRSAPHRELQDRALSVILGLILIPLAFEVSRNAAQGSATAGLAGAAAVAFSPVLVDLSTQVRPYAGVALVTALMTHASVRLQTSGRGWIEYAAAATIGFYLHALFATMIAAFAIGTLATAIRQHTLRSWLLANTAILLSIGPGLLFLHQQVSSLTIGRGRIPWGTTPTLERLLDQALVVLSGSEGGGYGLALIGIPLVFAGMAVAWNRTARGLLLVATLSLLLSFALAFRTGGFETRYHTASLTLTAIAGSAGAGRIVRKFRHAGLMFAAAAILIAGTAKIDSNRPGSRLPRSSARQVALLLNRAAPSDAIIVVPDTVAVAVNYYLAPRSRQIDLPALGRVDMIDFRGWTERLSNLDVRSAFKSELRTRASRGESVWLVIWQPMLAPLPPLSPQDAERSALPAQLALGTWAVAATAEQYRPAKTMQLVQSQEPMLVVLCEPARRP